MDRHRAAVVNACILCLCLLYIFDRQKSVCSDSFSVVDPLPNRERERERMTAQKRPFNGERERERESDPIDEEGAPRVDAALFAGSV